MRRIANPKNREFKSHPLFQFIALVSLVVEVLFCNQGVWVRFLPGAPNNATLADVVIAAVWSTVEVGSIPTGCTKFMRGSFNGKITGFHPVVKGSIPLPRTSLGYLQQTKIFHFLAVKSKQYPV